VAQSLLAVPNSGHNVGQLPSRGRLGHTLADSPVLADVAAFPVSRVVPEWI
jgi:hypothetical protein